MLVSVLCFTSYSSSGKEQNYGVENPNLTCDTTGTINPVTGTSCIDSNQLTTGDLVGGNDLSGFSKIQGDTSSIVEWYSDVDEIWFSHTNDIWKRVIAINQALIGTGMQIDGARYGWKVNNTRTNTINGNCTVAKTDGVCIDPLKITVEILDSAGNVKFTETYDYGDLNTFNINPNLPDPHWYSENQIAFFNAGAGNTVNGGMLAGTEIASATIHVQGIDGGYWQGNYGPRVKGIYGEFIYSANPCPSNPLYDPSCNGYDVAYAELLFTQQCTANPLYDPSCNGYATAYLNQQCNANPLYDVSCSGYATAYLTQQCSLDPLYDTSCDGFAEAHMLLQCTNDPLHDSSCSGYAAAYLTQQCSLDPLYDSSCSGYAAAYYNYQCAANPLYDSGCIGYATAYYNYHCGMNTLYDSGCPGYDTAYYNFQCASNPLYDSGCSGYDTAYYNYQCTANPLYDSGCSGYAAAYLEQQCQVSALYSTECTGYAVAYLNQQCSLNPLYDSSCNGHFEAQCSNNPLYDVTCTGYITAFYNQQCLQNPQHDDQCIGYVEPIIATPDPIVIAETEITGDSIVDEVISTPVVSNAKSDPIIVQRINEPVVVVIAPIQNAAVIVEPIDEVVIEINSLEDDIEQEIKQLEVVEVVKEKSEDPRGDQLPENDDEVETADSSTTEKEPEEPKVVEAPKKKELSKEQKRKLKNNKIKKLIATKAAALAKEMGEAVTLEMQRDTQNRVLALIGFVPDFNQYTRGEKLKEVAFYPDKPVVDHQYARWFLNDPNFVALEDLQYPNGFR